MIVFRNKGEIDLRAFSNFGVNAKDSDTAIGYFGTGLKYAVAVLLREGCEVRCFSGISSINFYLQKDTFRGKEFDFCIRQTEGCAPFELGYTTELGKNWTVKDAYRELASNCMDEGGDVYEVGDDEHPEGESNYTYIIIDGCAFSKAHADKHEIFLESAPLFVTSCMGIHNPVGAKNAGFYKGVRAIRLHKECLFTYNVFNGVTLTEDRTASSEWDYRAAVVRGLLSEVEDRHVLRTVLVAPKEAFEHDLDFHGWGIRPSPAFLETVEELISDRLVIVNGTAVKVWRETTQKEIEPAQIKLTALQKRMLQKAVVFCKTLGYDVAQYKILFVEALGGDCIGLADSTDDTIYICERVLHQGTKQLASTLVEEFLHLKHDYVDCTRSLQTYLFDKIISMGEEAQGEPL